MFEPEQTVLQQAEPWIRVVIDVGALLGGALVLFWKLDKRVSLMEQEMKSEFDRIHHNGFASKTEVARLEERLQSVQRYCAAQHRNDEPPTGIMW